MENNLNEPEIRSDIDFIYSAVMTDSDALEEAKMTLEVIKKTDPGVYDEMIDETISLINRALSNSILAAVDRLSDSPCREWVSLTEKEHTQIAIDCGCASADWVFYGAEVERKLKEINNG